ncbi:MAG TPA: methionine aminotransferase [Cyclobacteriaceae bacterium]|nr:methionine aminotransferase [Cyclobacteriaceae bacterium]
MTSRLPQVGTSIFTVMSKMALDHGAINLSQGFPDFPVSEELIELIYKNMRDGHNQYAPMPGAPALKQSIAKVVHETYNRPTDPDTEIIITAGGTEALYSAITAFIREGDEVIILDPAYDSYDPSVMLNGGVPVHINLKAPTFHVPWDEVKSKINSRTRAIMINTPHNPTGSVMSPADMKTLESIAIDSDIIVISDEVYERLIYEDKKHESVLKYPELSKRSVACFSFGKTFHATGWKVGYTVAPRNLTDEIRKTHQFITFAVNTPVQLAIATYLHNPENYLNLGKFYQQKRDFFLEQIKGSSFETLPCYGSYFQLLSYRNISKKTELEMAEWMTKEHKVASIPVSVFYKDGSNQQLLRFCFAKREETLEKAGKILRNL